MLYQIGNVGTVGRQVPNNETCLEFDSVKIVVKHDTARGRGCGSLGRAVTSNTRGLQFETGHWQNLYSAFVLFQMH